MNSQIEQVFREVLEDDDLVVTEELRSSDTAAWDSFAQVKLIIALEDEFGVKFTLDEVAEIRSVRDIVGALKAHGAKVE